LVSTWWEGILCQIKASRAAGKQVLEHLFFLTHLYG
jgi:hypothetical protein